MAFRYRREGQRMKTRMHLEDSSFKPLMKELKYDIFNFYYNQHMGPLAAKAIAKHQEGEDTYLFICLFIYLFIYLFI